MGGGGSKEKPDKQVGYNKNMFNFIKIVGKGGFGRVWKVSNKKSKQIFAMKVIDKAKVITKKSVSSVMNERELLAKIDNSFIVNMICAFQDRQNLYLLIDYLDAGDLRYYVNRNYNFDEGQIKFVIQCIMEGLRYLHDQNIIHRDIKPENIIFDKFGYCRITDMGIARHWKMENSNQTSGTPGYMAPEVLLRQNHSFCADYFAVGIIAFELVMNKRPYNGRNRKQIRDDMLARQAKIPSTVKTVSKQCIDFINKMIQRVARKRLGFNGIHQILQHPWLAMGKQSRKNFLAKKTRSPITTLQINYHSSLQQITQPDQLWKENILLLKRPQVQEMFANYDFDFAQNETDNKQLQRTSSSFNQQQSSSLMPPNTTNGRFFSK